MKKIYIIAAIMIVAAIALLVSASEDLSTYSTFSEAIANGDRVKVAGQLAKDKEMYYNPEKDPNYFSFYVRDNAGVEKKVVLLQAKPQDFEQSEQIVLTGRMEEDAFIATDVLLKCPSKYKDEDEFLKESQSS
jgi:cytochrome c-type biogenesis protein CcmE